MTLHIQIITPEKTLFDKEIGEVVVPTTTGELTILPHHIPLVTQVAPGIVVIKHNGEEESLAIDGGFIEVTEKSVTILADFALHAREASSSKAEEAKRNAQKAMQTLKSEKELETLQDEVRRAVLQLKLSQRVKH